MPVDIEDLSSKFALRIRRRIGRLQAGELPDKVQTKLGGPKVSEMAVRFVEDGIGLVSSQIPAYLLQFPDALRQTPSGGSTVEAVVIGAVKVEVAQAIVTDEILSILAEQWAGTTFDTIHAFIRMACGRFNHKPPACALPGAAVSSMNDVEVLRSELMFIISCAADPDVGPPSIERLLVPAHENLWFLDHVLAGTIPLAETR